ncbi:MAG: dTDP-4-dehydrorhamnose 3,5-epimerase [Vicinamibacterales bacterium]
MRFTETAVAGAFVVDLEPRGDERGFFARVWSRHAFEARGLKADFVEFNDSFSAHRGTLRGLHYQAGEAAEVKLARCIRGSVFDVAVDLRPGSPTYRRWTGVTLSADNRRMLYVPEGCAHGYLTLEDGAEVVYPVTHVYTPEAEGGIRWNDPAFGIEWPIAPEVISPKDQAWPDFPA